MGQFEINEVSDRIQHLAENILGRGIIETMSRVCERYGLRENEFRKYDVYKIITKDGKRIMKKASDCEASNYKKYLNTNRFNVPSYYGSYVDGKDLWIILENIEGNDLRDMTDELAIEAAESLAVIQNAYWNCTDTERFETYLKRIEKRYSFIKDNDVIGKAYKIFLERQLVCPRTMSNGDFLEFNSVNHEGKVYIIDWGFGGILPYSLDIARFIAHATENRATFPFYMNEKQKKLFVDHVYELLNMKPDYEQYLYDIKLAILNEYVEFIEADEDEDNWYLEHANILAKELIESN
ncbi:hypothetical protein [Butyrivibrio sp. NC3005]|uniref:hypothetical protein n=1 Tax=Butyrivibrio sp. NC3005 TaxID=1280685 RepID=UPI0012DD92E5|nr:hypothetical protein [Butyrivibrio sp. NC3005]